MTGSTSLENNGMVWNIGHLTLKCNAVLFSRSHLRVFVSSLSTTFLRRHLLVTMPYQSHGLGQHLHLLHGNEYFVVSAYEDQPEKCPQCVNSYQRMLCQKGLELARDVRNHLYKKKGRVYSIYKHHCHHHAIEFDLTKSFRTLHCLLSAVEDGLCVSPPLEREPGTSSSRLQDRVSIIERRPPNGGIRERTTRRSLLIGKREYVLIRKVAFEGSNNTY